MKRKRRDQRIMVRVNQAEKEALNKAAAVQDVPASQLIRQAIKKACLSVAGETTR